MNPPTSRQFATIGLVALMLSLSKGEAGDPTKAVTPPLPRLNAKVVEFARSHLGEPVGDGICITLAIEALQAAGARRFPLDDPTGEYAWGDPVPDFKDVLPGDILQFRDAVFAGSRSNGHGLKTLYRDTYPHHTAIVVKTAEKGQLITIAHQNVAVKGEDHAQAGRVREANLRMGSLQKGGRVRAYRPVLATPSRRNSDHS